MFVWMNGPIRLRQHGAFFIFLEKKWRSEPLFLQKERMSGTALPEAESPAGSMTA
jgi:hypothetical protein